MINEKKWINLYKFILVKLSYSFFTILLLFLSIIISVITITVFFSLKLAADTFFANFQYYIMIMYGMFLFIFVLMNAIKLFGTQIEDDSFLLLLTKPYSRPTIILTQYLGLFSFSILFITLNIITLLAFGSLFGTILKTEFLHYYIITILKLFWLLILFALLVTTGSVTLLALMKAQNVFLLFIIFCSSFLIAGLPYSLTTKSTDNIQLSFKNGIGPYTVKQVKSAILFNENYQKGLVKYGHLTSEIADFYNSLSFNELQNVNTPDMVAKRMNFFVSEGFYSQGKYTSSEMTGTVRSWSGHSEFNNQPVTIVLSFNNYFLSLEQLILGIMTNPNDQHLAAKQDLIQLYNDYNHQFNINDFMNLQKGKVPTLLDYNLSDSYIKLKDDKKQLTADEWTRAFKDSAYYVIFDGSLRAKYDAVFLNPVYILLRTVEDYIYNQVLIYHSVANNQIIYDANYQKYESAMSFYALTNKFNFIEHLNQLWTYFQGNYGDFWFSPLALSAIDFDVQKNNLFSYPDFRLQLNDENQIAVTATNSIQNNLAALIAYISLSVMLFAGSVVLFTRKNIG